ncbi:MAG: SemiSWEET family sugar transporter, partial [Marinirhabdus sp.]
MQLDVVELIGLSAAALTTAAFVPQVWQTIKTKDVSGLSLTMYCIFFTGVLLWLLYGIYIGSLAIILANAVTAVLTAVLLVLKL